MQIIDVFMNLSLPYQIGAVFISLGLLAVFILYLTGVVYSTSHLINEKKYEEYTQTQKNLMKMATVMNIMLLIAVVCYGVYYVYTADFSKFYKKLGEVGSDSSTSGGWKDIKSLARSILGEKDSGVYDAKCDKLFSSDPALNSQYLGMKSARPIAEVRNLCGNYAKNILGRKV